MMIQLTEIIEKYGAIIVFFPVLLGRIGLPVPAFPALMIAAALASGNAASTATVIIAGIGAGLLADFSWFVASRRHGRKLLSLMCKISLSPDSCVRQTEALHAKLGKFSLVCGKFVPGLGIVSIALASIAKMPAFEFAAFDLAAECLSVGGAVLVGVAFHSAILSVIATLADLGTFGLAVVVLGLATYIGTRWFQRQAFIKQLRMDRISADELGRIIDAGASPIIIDVRPPDVRLQEGIIPGALFAHPADTQVSLAEYPRDTDIVVYCCCPNEASAAAAAQHLRRAGFRKIRPLLGGLQAWAATGRQVAVVDSA